MLASDAKDCGKHLLAAVKVRAQADVQRLAWEAREAELNAQLTTAQGQLHDLQSTLSAWEAAVAERDAELQTLQVWWHVCTCALCLCALLCTYVLCACVHCYARCYPLNVLNSQGYWFVAKPVDLTLAPAFLSETCVARERLGSSLMRARLQSVCVLRSGRSAPAPRP